MGKFKVLVLFVARRDQPEQQACGEQRFIGYSDIYLILNPMVFLLVSSRKDGQEWAGYKQRSAHFGTALGRLALRAWWGTTTAARTALSRSFLRKGMDN